MEPQWNSSFQHPAPLCRHAPRSSFRIFSPPDIHPSTLHDCEDQHSSLHAHCLPPSSRTFPNGSSDVRNGPLPHCVPSLYLLPCFSISSSIFQTLAMATVTEVISTGFSNAMVRVFPFETFPTISELFHSENHFHHLPLNNVWRLLIVVCSSFSSWSQYGCVRLVFLLLLTTFTFFVSFIIPVSVPDLDVCLFVWCHRHLLPAWNTRSWTSRYRQGELYQFGIVQILKNVLFLNFSNVVFQDSNYFGRFDRYLSFKPSRQ